MFGAIVFFLGIGIFEVWSTGLVILVLVFGYGGYLIGIQYGIYRVIGRKVVCVGRVVKSFIRHPQLNHEPVNEEVCLQR